MAADTSATSVRWVRRLCSWRRLTQLHNMCVWVRPGRVAPAANRTVPDRAQPCVPCLPRGARRPHSLWHHPSITQWCCVATRRSPDRAGSACVSVSVRQRASAASSSCAAHSGFDKSVGAPAYPGGARVPQWIPVILITCSLKGRPWRRVLSPSATQFILRYRRRHRLLFMLFVMNG